MKWTEQAPLMVAPKLGDGLCGIREPLDEDQIQRMLVTEHGVLSKVLAGHKADIGDGRSLALASAGFHGLAMVAPTLRGEVAFNGLHGHPQIPQGGGFSRTRPSRASALPACIQTLPERFATHLNSAHSSFSFPLRSR